jgi:small subunit ribosomal protein S17e
MMKRISRGPVKGISLKLQEEEREKRLDYIPDISAVDLEIEKGIEIDPETKNMLRGMGNDLDRLPGLNVVSHKERRAYDRPRGDRPPRA